MTGRVALRLGPKHSQACALPHEELARGVALDYGQAIRQRAEQPAAKIAAEFRFHSRAFTYLERQPTPSPPAVQSRLPIEKPTPNDPFAPFVPQRWEPPTPLLADRYLEAFRWLTEAALGTVERFGSLLEPVRTHVQVLENMAVPDFVRSAEQLAKFVDSVNALVLTIERRYPRQVPTPFLWWQACFMPTENLARQPDETSYAALQLAETLARVRHLVETERVGEARELVSEALRTTPGDQELLRWQCLLAAPKVTLRPRTGIDRTREFEWLRTHSDAYRGKWVAVVGDRLLASASNLRTLLDRLSAGRPRPTVEPLIHQVL